MQIPSIFNEFIESSSKLDALALFFARLLSGSQQILKELGDEKSQRFYHLVAAKIPEPVIRETLAAIRADGARDPARLFTYKIKQYALERSRGEFEKRKQGLLHSM